MTNKMHRDIAIFGEALADVFPDRTVIGGAPLNVSRHLNALQMHPIFVTRLGRDALKETIFNTLQTEGLNTVGIQIDPTKPTGQVKVTLKDGQPSYAILEDQAYDHIHAGMTHLTMVSIQPKLKYFGTLAQRTTESRLALDTFIHDKPCPVFLDFNLREPWFTQSIIERSLERCDYAKMNETELATICQLVDIEGESSEALARALVIQFKLKQVIITCGEEGCWCLDDKLTVTKADAVPLSAPLKDAVGAGDGFAAVYMLGIVLDWPTELTMQRANAFASAICTIHGAAPESQEFYQQFQTAWQLQIAH